jgi:hypothetical protein
VQSELPALASEEAKEATLEVVQDALNRKEVVVGEFAGQNEEMASFIPWQTTVPDTLQRIDR